MGWGGGGVYYGEKVRIKNFNLKVFARKYYYVEKKGNGYAIGDMDQKEALGNR